MAKVYTKTLSIMQGECNAIIEYSHINWRNMVDSFLLGKCNQRDNRFLECYTKYNLMFANKLHPQKNSRKYTWHYPNGLTHNQIDYI